MRKYLFHIPYLARDNYSDNGYWHEGFVVSRCQTSFLSAGRYRFQYKALALKMGLEQFTDQTRSITPQNLGGEKGQRKDSYYGG